MSEGYCIGWHNTAFTVVFCACLMTVHSGASASQPAGRILRLASYNMSPRHNGVGGSAPPGGSARGFVKSLRKGLHSPRKFRPMPLAHLHFSTFTLGRSDPRTPPGQREQANEVSSKSSIRSWCSTTSRPCTNGTFCNFFTGSFLPSMVVRDKDTSWAAELLLLPRTVIATTLSACAKSIFNSGYKFNPPLLDCPNTAKCSPYIV
mmetsp:Transcript_5626/g.16183  ORF Transcript_5626/g.16183 Transcript_5626/m.16183 type:complete len:205 (+) Transcript_5626:585-1199(+)